MKKRIRLSEEDLKGIIRDVLSETNWKLLANAARKQGERNLKNPNASGKDKERLNKFIDGAAERFNKEYGFNYEEPKDKTKGSYRMTTKGKDGNLNLSSLETTTEVPSIHKWDGKTNYGKPTDAVLTDTFDLDSMDRMKHVFGDRHKAHRGLNKKRTSMPAVDHFKDRWDYMAARNKGNQELLDYANNRYSFKDGNWILDADAISIFSENEAEDMDCYRPPFCYAHGSLEDDLGSDMFYVGRNDAVEMVDDNGKLKDGTYVCNYRGRECVLFVYGRKPGLRGLCCYSDDDLSFFEIESMLKG